MNLLFSYHIINDMKNKPSVKKISEATGFSQATVSNALSGRRAVNSETARVIFETADRLGYDTSVNSMRSIKFVVFRKSGLIIDDSNFHPAVIEGVDKEAARCGLETIYCRLERNAPDYEEQVGKLLSDSTSGIILLATEMEQEDFRPFADCKNPLVLLDGWSETYQMNGVCIDNIDSAFDVVSYLYNKGHRKIGYVRGDFRIKAFEDRETGYRRALYKHGLTPDPKYQITVGTRTDTAMEDMKKWLDGSRSVPTAFFVDNDRISYGVIQALKQAGYDVPGDVSVFGFDDLVFSAVCNPQLSTVHVYKQEMGCEAVRRLISMMDGSRDVKFKTEVCTSLVERESVKDICN